MPQGRHTCEPLSVPGGLACLVHVSLEVLANSQDGDGVNGGDVTTRQQGQRRMQGQRLPLGALSPGQAEQTEGAWAMAGGPCVIY